MTQRLQHQDRILAALSGGATLVTASERLARAVRLTYAEARRAAGELVWERPAVLSWSAWLRVLLTQVQDAIPAAGPRLLSVAQAEALWESVIRESPGAERLLQPAATAGEAAQAWELCGAWQITLADCESAAAGEDARQFAGWARKFLRRCAERQWLEAAHLPDFLAAHIPSVAGLPPRVLLAGFEEYTPQQQALLDALGAAGLTVERLDMAAEAPAAARRVRCADAQTEMRCAAHWVRALLAREPQARIALVVQDLARLRAPFTRMLDEILCPGARLDDSPPRPYELSLGRPLADVPLVHDALALLEAGRRRLPFAAASLLLRSPFLSAADSEQDARARLELKLRDTGLQSLTLARLAALAREQRAPRLAAALNECLQTGSTWPATQPPSDWAGAFSRMLTALGWPGERSLDSEEFQARDAFHELLSEFARLDAVLGNLAFGAALARLRQLAAAQNFQPAGADVPVQVLGLPETAGLHFDYLWVMGLSDDVWPASPRPNAFIPWPLQRHRNLPHASAERELQYAQSLTRRLLASAGFAVASAAGNEGDTPLRPSPLIAELPLVDISELLPSSLPVYAEQLQREQTHAVTTFEDVIGPALAEDEQTRGGSALIRSQAACPFQAFGRYRLGAAPLTELAPGPDAVARGALVHALMETLWQRLGDQARLRQLDSNARRESVEACVAQVLHAQAGRYPETFTPNFRRLEAERLMRLLLEWLEVELERAPFHVVEREAGHPARFGSLQLKIRVDRIDELADGRRVLIDYKTGEADPGDWLGERPDEPQLPLYAVADPQSPEAVLFARLRTGECGYSGFSRTADVVSGLKAYSPPPRRRDAPPDWPALFAHWRSTLGALAAEFVRGEARVAPKYGADTCKYCHLAMLCRIHDLGPQPEADGDD